MRCKIGDSIECVNNGVWKCLITKIYEKQIELRVLGEIKQSSDKFECCLAFSLIRSTRVGILIEKCVEIGITKFQPIISERCQIKKIDIPRMLRIAKEAAEQSKKTSMPQIFEPVKLTEIKDMKDFWIAVPNGVENPKILPKGILIGPEGGWTNQEQQYCIENGAISVKFGEYVLRSETAAIVAVFTAINCK